MKKLFYLLFISFALASCTKDEPVEVVCTCDGATNGTGTSSSSFNCDTSLVGLWMGTATGSSYEYDFYINESGDGYLAVRTSIGGVGSNSGYYSCTNGLLSFVEVDDDTPLCFSGNYSISGNTMIYEVIAGSYDGVTFTLTKQ